MDLVLISGFTYEVIHKEHGRPNLSATTNKAPKIENNMGTRGKIFVRSIQKLKGEQAKFGKPNRDTLTHSNLQ